MKPYEPREPASGDEETKEKVSSEMNRDKDMDDFFDDYRNKDGVLDVDALANYFLERARLRRAEMDKEKKS